jgi:cytochrome c553
MRRRGSLWRIVVVLAAVSAAGPARAQDVASRWREVCATCHGPAGRSEQPEIPSIGGQPVLFTAIQLFLFREGRRTGTPLSDAMTEIAKPISDADLRAFADFVATLPPPAASDGPVDEARYRRGVELAGKQRCPVCHNADLSGREQMPRIAAQREDYLVKALGAYKSGRRVGGQAAMNDAVVGLSDEQLADLAYAVARWREK